MQILIDQAVYDLRNKGNVSLLQVEVERLRGLFPQATIQVITSAPHILKLYCPDATPVRPADHALQTLNARRLDMMHRWVPPFAWRWFLESREELRYRGLKSGFGRGVNDQPDPGSVDDEVATASAADGQEEIGDVDLFVAGGGGFLADADKSFTLTVLNRLESAARRGIPTVMVGQGVGPLKDPALRARASDVLPGVDLILVRDKLIGPGLLYSLGVDPGRVLVTGDDAAELAYRARVDGWGAGIGVSVRVAHYTEVGGNHLHRMKPVLQRAAARFDAPLVALPIGTNIIEADGEYIAQLLAGYRKAEYDRSRFESPLAVIRRTQRCRVVVAGAFHAALFAMAQGIPAIGIVKSVEYSDKFHALADMFGAGCEVIRLDDAQFEDKLETAIEHAWSSAEQIRPQLLAAAARQIDAGCRAFERIRDLVTASMPALP